MQALELVLRPEREADVLVCVSHEGATALTLEAVHAWPGESWLITGKAESPLADACDEVVVCTPVDRGELVPHGELHGRGRDDRGAERRGRVVATRGGRGGARRAGAPGLRPRALARRGSRPRLADRAGGRAEAARGRIRRRGGARDGAAAARLPRGGGWDVRAFVLEGDGRGAERAHQAVAALEAIGVTVTLVPTRHPVVDIVPFQRLTVDLADHRGVDPDRIRRDDERWAAAAAAAKTSLDSKNPASALLGRPPSARKGPATPARSARRERGEGPKRSSTRGKSSRATRRC